MEPAEAKRPVSRFNDAMIPGIMGSTMSYLDLKDLSKAQRVCKYWEQVIASNFMSNTWDNHLIALQQQRFFILQLPDDTSREMVKRALRIKYQEINAQYVAQIGGVVKGTKNRVSRWPINETLFKLGAYVAPTVGLMLLTPGHRWTRLAIAAGPFIMTFCSRNQPVESAHRFIVPYQLACAMATWATAKPRPIPDAGFMAVMGPATFSYFAISPSVFSFSALSIAGFAAYTAPGQYLSWTAFPIWKMSLLTGLAMQIAPHIPACARACAELGKTNDTNDHKWRYKTVKEAAIKAWRKNNPVWQPARNNAQHQ